MANKVLVIAAHPDDEILGCGGSMRRHVEAGDDVSCLIMAEGITSRGQNGQRSDNGDLNKIASAANIAANIIGYSNIILEKLPDNKMDSLPLLEIMNRELSKVSTQKNKSTS